MCVGHVCCFVCFRLAGEGRCIAVQRYGMRGNASLLRTFVGLAPPALMFAAACDTTLQTRASTTRQRPPRPSLPAAATRAVRVGQWLPVGNAAGQRCGASGCWLQSCVGCAAVRTPCCCQARCTTCTAHLAGRNSMHVAYCMASNPPAAPWLALPQAAVAVATAAAGVGAAAAAAAGVAAAARTATAAMGTVRPGALPEDCFSGH